MTATPTTGLRPWPARGPSGAALRRVQVLTEILGAVLLCIIGFHLLIDTSRHLEVGLSGAILNLLGEHDVSTLLGDSYLVLRHDGPPIVAHLTPSCSALSSVLALTALALVGMRQRGQSVVGLFLAITWVVLANQVRLVLSLLAGATFGVRSLVLFHDWVGAVLNFCFILIGLLIMVAFTMHPPQRAEQDRSGRHTARRPLAWGRPGLGYRVELEELPRGSRIQVLGFVHRRLLPAVLSKRLAARRERNRVDYRLGHLSPPERAAAVQALAANGLGAHAATLIAVASFEADGLVLNALAEAVAARQWEPLSDRRILALRLWARAWVMRQPIDHGHGAVASRRPGRTLVAVTGAGGPAGIAVVRSLLAAGEQVLALDADPGAAGMRLGCLSAVLPRADDPAYPDALARVVDRHRPAALICTVAEEYTALDGVTARLAELGCRTWLPPLAAAATCNDKAAFAAVLRSAGVPHPGTATTIDDAVGLPGPWIVKPASGRGSRDVLAVDSLAELRRAFTVVPSAIAQTRLTGQEFTADALVARDGTLLTCVPRWRDETKAGISVRGTTFDSAAVTRVVAATLAAVGLTGPACVQGFVADPQALAADPDAAVDVTVIEVNPRFSGGLPLTLAAGADVVGTFLTGILDPDAELPALTFAPGVRMVRHFSELYSGPDGTEVVDPFTRIPTPRGGEPSTGGAPARPAGGATTVANDLGTDPDGDAEATGPDDGPDAWEVLGGQGLLVRTAPATGRDAGRDTGRDTGRDAPGSGARLGWPTGTGSAHPAEAGAPDDRLPSRPAAKRPPARPQVRRLVLVPFGTRPEVIKIAPVVRALRAAGHVVTAVHTGQHTDAAMAADVERDLGLVPDVRNALPEGTDRFGALVAGAAASLVAHRPDVVLALGDTHTVPAYALAARGAGVPFAHLEAGLRSFNQRSVEEVNRRVAAAVAQLHFAPTDRAAAFLAAEGVAPGRVFVVGNPVIDALRARAVERRPVAERAGVLLTAHRASNVDDPERLERLVTLVAELAANVGPVLFPVHPRTAGRLREHHRLGYRLNTMHGVRLCDPLPYPDLLTALAGVKVAVTDSGGLQEEAAYFGVPVVVLRRSTPRWESVENGSAVLTGLTSDAEAASAAEAAVRLSRPDELARVAELECPYGDGRTGQRVADILSDPATTALLELAEPDFGDGTFPWEPAE